MRRFLCILVVILMTLSFFGCFRPERPSGIDSDMFINGCRFLPKNISHLDFQVLRYAGDWFLSYGIYQGVKVTAKEAGTKASINIQPNGSLKMIADGKTVTGKCEVKGGKLVLRNTGDSEPIAFQLKDGKLFIEESGVEMFFEKK